MKRLPRGVKKVDWTATSASLVERLEKPTVLVDSDGKIWLFNAAMEELLGRKRIEVLGRDWIKEFVPPSDAEAASWRLNEAASGAIKRCECPVLTSDGERLLLTLDFDIIGHRTGAALLATLVSAKRSSEPIGHHGMTALSYEISTAASEFGRLRKLSSPDESLATAAMIGRPCYQAIHRRDCPCEGCPALHPDSGIRRTSVVSSGWDEAPFAIVNADPSSEGARRMTAYFLGRSVTTGLTRARVASLCESAGLSQREREVFNLLLLGRSPREIAHALGIGERTVKFHQTNILEKLGAESRLDIFRLLY